MKKITVLYWVSGSCGDLVSSLLLSDNTYKAAIKYPRLISSGKVDSNFNKDILKLFPKQKNKHWYMRTWINDLNILNKLDFNFLLQTVSVEEFNFLKNNLKNATFIVINYDENLFPYVAKNFCKKVLDYPNYLTKDDVGSNFLNTVAKTIEDQRKFLKLQSEKKLGLWYLENLLKGNLHFPPKKSIQQANIVIELDQLLNINYFNSIIEQLNKPCSINYDSTYKFYLSWLNLQDKLYTTSGSKKHQQQLGYNKTFKLLDSTNIDTTSDYNNLFLKYTAV